MVDSARAQASGPVEFVFYVDDDAQDSVPADLRACSDVTGVRGPRIVLSQMWNECAKTASGDILMQCGDDIVFGSPAWDAEVRTAIEAYPDRIVLAYGDDRAHGQNLATHSFQHRRWSEVTGYFVPPYFSSDFNDLWLHEVAAAIKRLVYLPQVVTEHMHPAFSKGEWDQTHMERIARHQRDNVHADYYSRQAERQEDARKLLAEIERAAHAAA